MECEEVAACSRYKSEDQGFENTYIFNWCEHVGSSTHRIKELQSILKIKCLKCSFWLFIFGL